MPNQFPIKLENREFIAKDTMLFTFSCNDILTFQPGQHIQIIIPEIYDVNKVEGMRFFSIIPEPCCPSKFKIATRIRSSAFKSKLVRDSIGKEYVAFGPLGSFGASPDYSNFVLLAAGIGITALLPIVIGNHNLQTRKTALFYYNLELEEVAFASDLFKMADEWEDFSFFPYLATGNHGLIKYRVGKITDSAIKSSVKFDVNNAQFLLAGPPKMVFDLRKTVQEMGIAQRNTQVEIFSGY